MARTPAKPAETPASMEQLLAHYEKYRPQYNEVALELKLPRMESLALDTTDRATLIQQITAQDRALKRVIRREAERMLMETVKDKEGNVVRTSEGRTIGYSYAEILHMLQANFPAASTSVKCLRWYVAHLVMDAQDLGQPRPKLPQYRPRRSCKAIYGFIE
jgi:hypothetical protein